MITQMRVGKVHFIAAFILCAVIITGCASSYSLILPKPPDQYQKLGEASGEACGSMLLLFTAYNFIPIDLNERTQNAYQRALASVPGATGLINVTLQDHWFWWVIGSTKCVTITGEAIR